MTEPNWDAMTTEQAMRLLAAVEDPQFASRLAFRDMNEVADDYKAGNATYEEYTAAFAEFERAAREDGSLA